MTKETTIPTSIAAYQQLPAIGRLDHRFDGVERIAVLRGGGLGDLMFALPALDALAAAYPDARITLLGTPLHAALLADRPGPVTDVVELPFFPGVRDGASPDADPVEEVRAVERFFAEVGDVDLAVQVHGGGRNSNPFLMRLGARHTAGLATPDAPLLERTVPYVYYQHEVLRSLEVVGAAGAVPVTLEPRLEVMEHERDFGSTMRRADRLVVIHPGATDLRRRWPTERFAEVASRLAQDGVQVLVVGDGSEAELAADVCERAGGGGLVSSIAGELSIGQLVGVLSAADVVLANDSGPRHLAAAIGAATVGVFWVGNVINAGPFARGRHRVQPSWTTHCPVCGRDATQVGWTSERCEHELSFIADVAVDPVYADVVALLGSPAVR